MISGSYIEEEEKTVLKRIEQFINKNVDNFGEMVIELIYPNKILIDKKRLSDLEDHKERTMKILEDIAEKTYPWSDEC